MRLCTLLPLAGALALGACSSSRPDAAPSAGTATAPRPTPSVLADPTLAQRYAASITEEDLAAHLYLYASDEFEGRDTGTRGQRLAAKYLASVYRRLGLTPKGNAPGDDPRAPERYFQPVRVYGQHLERATFTAMNGDRAVLAATFGPGQENRHVLPGQGGNGDATCEVVFLGYGIISDTWNDLTGLSPASLAGKCLVIFEGEPTANGLSLVSPDSASTRWSRSRTAKTMAIYRAMGLLDEQGRLPQGAQGPAAILTVSDLASGADAFAGNVARSAAQPSRGLSVNRPNPTTGVPTTLSVSTAFADALLGVSSKTVAGLRQQITTQRQPASFAVSGARLASSITRTVYEVPTENV
ncbi:MAG TPA: hypothetical protein VD948_08190, partial [Rhodothermales bacterium]|nr:hypothetical protein [Rhodothermales bacterium]